MAKDLSGTYITRVVFHFGSHALPPGSKVTLSHVEAELAIAQGTVEVPQPEFEDPSHIPSEAEFLAEMKKEYPKFRAYRVQKKERFEAVQNQESDDVLAAAQAAKAKADEEAAIEAKKQADDAAAKAAADAAAAATKTTEPAAGGSPAPEANPPSPKGEKNRK